MRPMMPERPPLAPDARGSEAPTGSVADDLRAVMVTFRRPDELAASLAELASQTTWPAELLVIDNGSDPRTADLVARCPITARVVDAGANLGPAGALALGCELALADGFDGWVLFLDDDDPPVLDDVVEQLLALRARATGGPVGGVGIAGARYSRRAGRVARLGDQALHGIVEVDYVGGGQCPMYAADALRAVGGPRAEMFFGFDDLDLGVRIVDAGWRVVVDGDRLAQLRARHQALLAANPPAVAAGRAVAWRRYYSARNLVAVARSAGGATATVAAALRGLAAAASRLVRSGTLVEARAEVVGVGHGLAGRHGRTVAPGDLPRWRSTAEPPR